MNCTQCQEQLVAYVENLLDPRQQRETAAHLQGCPVCRAEADEHARLRDRLIRDAAATPRSSLEASVMERVFQERTINFRRIAMRRRYGKVGLGVAAAAAIVAVLVVPWGDTRRGAATAAEVMTQAVSAVANLKSVYVKVNVRTLPRDNFELIGVNYDFVPIELWKRFGDPPRWRAELPGRVVVMDGESATGLIQPNHAYEAAPAPSFQVWVGRLMDVDQVLENEMQQAHEMGWDLSLHKEMGADGALKSIVTIEAKAQGDFSSDWMRNKSVSESDTRRVYRFDAETARLEDVKVWVHLKERDVLVLETDTIVYDPEPDDGLFTLKLPDDVIWSEEPEILPDNDKYAQMTPDETARAFFQALADQNWDEVRKFYSVSKIDWHLKMGYGGLEIVKIGEPFQSGQYGGWFVPYEIKLRSGEVKKHNLALRNDNEAGRYVVDGGF